jgi:hypothetical protein
MTPGMHHTSAVFIDIASLVFIACHQEENNRLLL